MKNYTKSKWLICSCLAFQLLWSTSSYANATYPATYDLRDEEQVTSIKDQGKTNKCWAYAAMSSLESTLKKSRKTTYDFSEQHIVDMSQDFKTNTEGSGINKGGTLDMAIAYFINSKGPVFEKSYDSTTYYVGEIKKFSPASKSNLDNDNFKEAIMEDGAVYSSMNYDQRYFNSLANSYYCDSKAIGQSHAVALVGWDDNYSKDNFSPKVPAGDGAFICKNQYGGDFGENGYFYVSYYDMKLRRDENAVFKAVIDMKFDRLYGYDEFGNTDYYVPSSAAVFANTFRTGSKDELLNGVGFFTENEVVPYEVYLIEGAIGGETVLPKIPLSTGETTYAGYHTVKIPATAIVGDSFFTVVVKFPETVEKIALESRDEDYTPKATAKSGQSYILVDGTFKDLTTLEDPFRLVDYGNSNVCLKAFSHYPSVETADFSIREVKWDHLEAGERAEISLTTVNKTTVEKTLALGLCLYENIGGHYKMIRSGFVDDTLSSGGQASLSLSTLVPDDDGRYMLKGFLWETSDGNAVIISEPFTTEIRQEVN